MKTIQKIKTNASRLIPTLALALGVFSTSQVCCIWWFHQPKVPNSLKKAHSTESEIHG